MNEILITFLSIRKILTTAWSLFFNTFAKIFPFSLLYAAFNLSPQMTIRGSLAPLLASHQSETLMALSSSPHFWLALSLQVLGSLIAFYLLLLMVLRIGKPSGHVECPAYVMPRQYLLCLLGSLLFLIIFSFGFLLFIIPGFYLYFLLVFFLPNLLLDHQSFFASFKASARLVYGHWWRTFAVFFLAFIAALFILLLLKIIFGMLYFIVAHHYIEPDGIAMLASSIFFQALLLPWFIAVFLTQFYDLKTRYLSQC